MRNQLTGLVAFSLLAGCKDDLPTPHDPGPTQLSISIVARNEIAGVRQLTLMVSPSSLMTDCENSDPGLGDGCVAGQTNLRFFTDRDGLNRVMKPQGAPCPGTNAAPTDMRCWAAENDLTLFDALATDTRPIAYVARDNEIESFMIHRYTAFGSVVFNRWARDDERDSYVWLSDGRECEVKPLFPRPPFENVFWGPLPEWIGFGAFPLTNFSIRPGERWHIMLVVDLGTVDPALCGTNQPLHITPVSATAELLENCHAKNGSCVTQAKQERVEQDHEFIQWQIDNQPYIRSLCTTPGSEHDYAWENYRIAVSTDEGHATEAHRIGRLISCPETEKQSGFQWSTRPVS